MILLSEDGETEGNWTCTQLWNEADLRQTFVIADVDFTAQGSTGRDISRPNVYTYATGWQKKALVNQHGKLAT